MKNPLYIKRGYQFLVILGRHFIALGICILCEIFGVLGFFQFNFMRILLGITFAGVHFYILYKGALTLAKGDLKSYTPLEYNAKWAILWGAMISVITLVFMLLYRLNWIYFSVDGGMTNNVSVVMNFVFYLLESPYMAFLYGVKTPGTLPWYISAVMLILPICATYTGYYLARNEDKVRGKIHDIMFESSEDEE